MDQCWLGSRPIKVKRGEGEEREWKEVKKRGKGDKRNKKYFGLWGGVGGGVKDDEVGRGRNVSSFCSVVSVVSYRGFREDGSQCGNSLEHTWISVDWTSRRALGQGQDGRSLSPPAKWWGCSYLLRVVLS